eukprot:6458283-Pyramimonas_sp.AAC.1
MLDWHSGGSCRRQMDMDACKMMKYGMTIATAGQESLRGSAGPAPNELREFGGSPSDARSVIWE